ncbi:MAG TPA: rRNA maturation RNase YbeY [Roseiarcus sp.]|jgi:probable rRNA maturation factor|nr:rRNA maturation RNase YbeY [Roseiarcus sp.]
MKRQSGSARGRRPSPESSRPSHKSGRQASRLERPRPQSATRSGAEPNAQSRQIKLDIAIERPSPLWAALPGAKELAERAVLASAIACGVALGEKAEVSVQLVDDEQIRALNARWRGLDQPTNVLSFPAAPVERLAAAPLLGDIVVAYETTRREAEDERIGMSDHFAHLVVHGFLHLVGFDHQSGDEAEKMEALETRVLAGLAIADPYANDVPAERE